MKKMHVCRFLLPLVLAPYLAGCAKLALRASPSLVPNMTKTFFEECDPEMAKASLPAELKLLEGLLKSDPRNPQLLTSLCMGFTGYAMLFVEDEDPERASNLYLRAMDFGLRRLGLKPSSLGTQGPNAEALRNILNTFQERDLDGLFWLTMSWQAWINLNLDKPATLSQLGMAQSCLDRILKIDPAYFHGTPYVLMGSILAAKPALLGGDPVKAGACFEKAMRVSEGKFFLVQYYYAKFYAVRTQNKQLFLKLLKEVAEGSPSRLRQTCLINAVMVEKARRLLKAADDLFI